jgi:hypothetical protein
MLHAHIIRANTETDTKYTLSYNPSENTECLPTNERQSVTFKITCAYGSNFFPSFC